MILAVLAFVLALYWDISTYVGTRNLKRATHTLMQTSRELDLVAEKIDSYHRLRSSLMPCRGKKTEFKWEEVELHFEPITFQGLLNRLTLLNQEIENKYRKRGLFILTDFETLRNEPQARESGPASDMPRSRPGFKIMGKLLCLCQ